MISLPRINRLAAAQRFTTLLEDVLANGRCLPLPLRLRLAADADSLPAIALALALQRFLELTLGPTPQALAITRALLDRRHPADSAFGSPAANAAALAALCSLQDHLCWWHSAPDLGLDVKPIANQLTEAINDAVAALRSTLDNSPSTLTGLPLLSDELDTLIALWQLADHSDIADLLDLPALLCTLEDRGLRHDAALAPFLARAESALSTTVTHAPTLAA